MLMLVLGGRKALDIIMTQHIAITAKPWRLRIRIVKALALIITVVFTASKAAKVTPLCLMLLMLRPDLSKGTHTTTHGCTIILLLRGRWRIEVRRILPEVSGRLGLHLLRRGVLLRLCLWAVEM